MQAGAAPVAAGRARQTSLDQLGVPLVAVTFAVLDLETTGLDPRADRITEIGVVKVRGGDILGEFQCLLRPAVAIPAGVAALTGISEALVADRPSEEAVLPSLLEFLRGCVLVAHNAHFDLRFLQAALRRHGYPPLDQPVVDTARLARRALTADEVHDCRLATLAQLLRARVAPTHRALPDARATVDVLHGLLERVGALGVTTLEELRDYLRSTSDPAYRKVRLVEGAPDAPGTYRFLDRDGRVLYVGKAARLRQRLRRYFGQDRRRRVADLVRETARVTWEPTPTELEAAVREVRAIAAHRPRYNRRSRNPERAVYVKLTREPFPRLSVVTAPRDPAALHVGPLPSRRVAQRFVDAVHDVLPLRRCTARLNTRGDQPPCVLKDLGRCGAPCDGSQDTGGYAAVVADYVAAVTDDPTPLLAALRRRMHHHAARGRFEQAERDRLRLHDLAGVLATCRRLQALAAATTLVATRRDHEQVEVVLVQRGRLAGTDRVAAGGVNDAVVRLRASAPPPATGPVGPRELEEVRLVSAWLDQPEVRLVEVDGGYATPVAGGRALAATLAEARRVERAVRRDRDLLTRSKVVRRAT